MNSDPLIIKRKGEPANIAGLWYPYPAFLVCGGPSLKDHPLERLKERGVVSLGVNLAAAFAPVRAWCFGDPQGKFCHGLFLDPAIMTFAPLPKLGRKFVVKLKDGFQVARLRVDNCPNTYGYSRLTYFMPKDFFDTPHAHWGPGKHQPADVPPVGCLCTMLVGLRLLYYLGVRRIYLLGVDYKGRDGMCYGFPNRKRERNRRFKREGEMLRLLKPVFDERGLEVYNCNQWSACDLFPYVPFDVALENCKGDVGDEPLDTIDWYDKKLVVKQCEGRKAYKPRHFGREGCNAR